MGGGRYVDNGVIISRERKENGGVNEWMKWVSDIGCCDLNVWNGLN